MKEEQKELLRKALISLSDAQNLLFRDSEDPDTELLNDADDCIRDAGRKIGAVLSYD